MTFHYTGIGSRAIPTEMVDEFVTMGITLAKTNMVLRSGGADGADSAFEKGCRIGQGKMEIYIPWKGFNKSESNLYYIPPEAYEIAGDVYGSTWQYVKPAVRKLMARNMLQVMGQDLETPSKFVLCWTPDGCTTRAGRTRNTGGTGQAIAYASELNIPVFNYRNPNTPEEFLDFFAQEIYDEIQHN